MATYYIEGDKDTDHMVVEGMTASEATCYFDVFYGREPRHLRRLPNGWSKEHIHYRTYTVSVPEGAKCAVHNTKGEKDAG